VTESLKEGGLRQEGEWGHRFILNYLQILNMSSLDRFCVFIYIYFLVVLEFELRASCLLSSRFAT
jgi:hypothetical protein